jgi:hypothetical protein
MHSPGSRQCNRTLLKKYVVPRTCGVRSLNPNRIPRKDVHPELVAERGLACILGGTKEVPLPCRTFLLDAEVGAIDCHQTIIANVVNETTLKNDLWFV